MAAISISAMGLMSALLWQQPQVPAPAPVNEPEALALQVKLDRAGFSPGVIDGWMGPNTRKALEAYRAAGRANGDATAPTTSYRITAADAAGPFVEITGDLMQQAKLDALSYSSLIEKLAERFHATPDLLRRLNPEARFAAGETIIVPNVEPMVIPALSAGTPDDSITGAKPAVTVTVSKATSALTVTGPNGRVLFYAPVTTGSERDPLPIGEWKVRGAQLTPVYYYNPELFWDADSSHSKATIAPGPNNPVGLVWIDISKEHYGLHGTPVPAAIGRTESHGCVRLTNWDALQLASMVAPGTPVIFTP